MNNYIISYEFASETERNAWVAESNNRHGYEKDGFYIGIDWRRTMTDEEYTAEADTIGNNLDEHGRTGLRNVVRYVDENETIDSAINRAMIETAIQYGVFISQE